MIQSVTVSTEHLSEMTVETNPGVNEARSALLARFRRNAEWYEQRTADIDQRHPGQFVCVSGQELFVGETLSDVMAQARAKHPQDDAPFVHYVPRRTAALLGGVGLRLTNRPSITTARAELTEDDENAS